MECLLAAARHHLNSLAQFHLSPYTKSGMASLGDVSAWSIFSAFRFFGKVAFTPQHSAWCLLSLLHVVYSDHLSRGGLRCACHSLCSTHRPDKSTDVLPLSIKQSRQLVHLLVTNWYFVVAPSWGSCSLCRCDEHGPPGARSAFLLLHLPCLSLFLHLSQRRLGLCCALWCGQHRHGPGSALRQARAA